MENVWAKQRDWKCSFVACAHPSVPPGESPFPDFQGERTSARRLQFCCFLLHKMLSQWLQCLYDSSLLTVIRWNGQHLSKFTTYNIPCRKFSTLSAFVFSLVLMFRWLSLENMTIFHCSWSCTGVDISSGKVQLHGCTSHLSKFYLQTLIIHTVYL